MCTSRISGVACLIVLLLATIADAQESKLITPQPEHALLRRFVGEWSFVKKAVPADGKSAIVGRGEISARMVGDFFALCQWKGDLYGTDFEAVQTLGYSITKKQYVGTWIDSILSHLWHFEGEANKAGNKVVVIAEGPGPGDGTAEFKETYDFRSPDEIVITGEMKQGNQWIPFMTTELKRTKRPAGGHSQGRAPKK